MSSDFSYRSGAHLATDVSSNKPRCILCFWLQEDLSGRPPHLRRPIFVPHGRVWGPKTKSHLPICTLGLLGAPQSPREIQKLNNWVLGIVWWRAKWEFDVNWVSHISAFLHPEMSDYLSSLSSLNAEAEVYRQTSNFFVNLWKKCYKIDVWFKIMLKSSEFVNKVKPS